MVRLCAEFRASALASSTQEMSSAVQGLENRLCASQSIQRQEIKCSRKIPSAFSTPLVLMCEVQQRIERASDFCEQGKVPHLAEGGETQTTHKLRSMVIVLVPSQCHFEKSLPVVVLKPLKKTPAAIQLAKFRVPCTDDQSHLHGCSKRNKRASFP